MTETQRRIRIYKNALPHLKERVTAVALLLAISVSMMATASFAWVTLSTAPEVNGLATTVATNGNLEIALSNKKGTQPNESTATDGAGAITETNLTWGNLINLSDESYGLDHLTLRPATLETGKLLTSPLKSVTYSEDGRVSGTISNFAYTNFRIDNSGAKAFFVPENGTEYGVRAISSVTFNSVLGDAMLISLSNSVEANRTRADVSFKQLYNDPDYMNAITGLAGVYLTYRDKDVDQDVTKYVESIYFMMQDYATCLDYIGQSLLSAANLHHFVYCNNNDVDYTAFSIDDIKDGTAQATLSREGVTLNAMASYRNSVSKFYGSGNNAGVYTPIESAYNSKRYVGWEEMSKYINVMANIYTTTVNGVEAQSISGETIDELLAGGTNPKAVIKSGLIVDMEKMLGTGLQVNNLKMSGTLKGIPFNLTVSVTTAVTEPYYLVQDALAAEAKAEAGGLIASDAVAADTYGMALDFWLRTNARDSKLKLEGELVYERREVLGPDGQPELDENDQPKTEMVAVGYTGANRIWEEDDPGLPVVGTSTSQGTGSCYVFYPSSEEDKIQSLNLLRAISVAFVSEDGSLLAQADLDTVNAIENYGRVLVPLQIREEVLTVIDPETNEETEVTKDYITEMVQNQATRITALVYLDGTMLTNSEVLAASSINGHLNIQFGTDEDISSVDKPDLKDDYYQIALTATNTRFDKFDPLNPPKAKLTLELDGMEADSITGNFVSYISETQGSRQPTFSFEHKGGKIWEANVEFKSAGNFELRSVQIDGVDCMLSEDQVVRVEIKGVAVDTVVCQGWNNPNTFSLMTANSYYPLDMEINLNIGDGIKTPTDVRAVFNHSEGQNVTLSFSPRSSTKWTAKGNFTASGKYTLSYLLVDGGVVALNTTQTKTMDLTLGVEVRTFLRSPVNAAYRELEKEMANALKNASENEYANVKADYEARLEELLEQLYVGNPNDDKDALELVETSTGYRFYHDGSETLFMDVTCVVVNDKDREITGLTGTYLYYAVGNNTEGRPFTKLTWNSSAQCYEGTLEINSPGTYSFQYLTIPVTGEPEPMYITSSPGAPKIQAISPKPISYQGLSAINSKENVVNINPNASRWIGFVLRDAPSAEAVITVRHTGSAANAQAYRTALNLSETTQIITNPDGSFSYDLTVEASKVRDELEGDWFFYADVPHDGKWTITDMQIYSAFYGGVFYDGTEEGTGYLTDELLGLDLTDEDKIESTFFTTVKFSASDSVPGILNTEQFMEPSYNKAITFKLTDYLGNPIQGAGIHLSYTWGGTPAKGYTLQSGTIPAAWKTLGGDLTQAADGSFTTPVLGFRLSGDYKCEFSVTYNGREYDVSKFTMVGKEFTADDVTVYWDLPVLTVTGATGATKGALTGNETFPVNLGNDGSDGSYNALNGVQNYFDSYYANVYISSTGKNSHTMPTVTLSLDEYGSASQATALVKNNSNADFDRTYTFKQDNGFSAEQTIGDQTSGSFNIFNKYRHPAGKQTVSQVTMTYEGVSFTADLDTFVTINQQRAPAYLTLNYDSDRLGTIGTVNVTAYNNKGEAQAYTVKGTRGSIVITSPNGNAFDVQLPGATRVVENRIHEELTGLTLSNEHEAGLVYWVQPGTCSDTYHTYTVWECTGTETGTRTYYKDTYTIEKWDGGAVGEVKNISAGTTYTATVDEDNQVTGTEPMNGEDATYMKYVFLADYEEAPAGGTPKTEAEITTSGYLNEYKKKP